MLTDVLWGIFGLALVWFGVFTCFWWVVCGCCFGGFVLLVFCVLLRFWFGGCSVDFCCLVALPDCAGHGFLLVDLVDCFLLITCFLVLIAYIGAVGWCVWFIGVLVYLGLLCVFYCCLLSGMFGVFNVLLVLYFGF